MRTFAKKKIIWILVTLVSLSGWFQPARAISIKEEEELAREFLKVVAQHFELIDDPFIVSYVRAVGKKISRHTHDLPFTFHFYVIKEDVYNAFAIPAGHIFINSGLLAAMESEDELAGILSHEMAHAACRHISQQIDRSKKIDLASMAGMVAGIFLGAATGDATALQALTIGSAAAGQAATLAYSRTDETQADQLGLIYLQNAGYSGRGLVSALKRIRSKQWFGTQQVPSYMMTHPAVEERIAQLDTDIAVQSERGVTSVAATPQGSVLFNKVVIRLKALYDPPDAARQYFENGVKAHPGDPDWAYGNALVLARLGHREEAADYCRQALAKKALDPLILGDLGRIYFLDGRYEDALRTLDGVTSWTDVNPESIFYLGRTQMELGDLKAAVASFEKLKELYPDYRPTYQFLGESYGRLSIMPEAHFNLGMYNYKSGDFRTALYHLKKAKEGIADPAKLEEIEKILKDIGRLPEKPPEK
jgi:predicted Zn-dependent protease